MKRLVVNIIETHNGPGVIEVACSANSAIISYLSIYLCAKIVESGHVIAVGDTE